MVPALARSIRSAVVSALMADAGVSAIVEGRVYPGALPRNATGPALVYQLIAVTRERGLGGPTGLSRAVFQFGCARGRGTDGESLAEALRQMFDGFIGPIGPYTIIESILASETDLTDDPSVPGSGEPNRRTVLELTLRYRESIPSR